MKSQSLPTMQPVAVHLRIFAFFASWKLSIVITLSLAIYAIFLTIWGARSPAHVVQTIAGMLPFTVFYILLLLNTACCILRRTRPLFRGMSSSPIHLPHRSDWNIVVDRLPRFAGSSRSNDAGFYWVYRRFSALGTLLLHISIFVLALGFWLSQQSHIEGSLTIGQNQHIRVDPTMLKNITPQGRDSQDLPTPTMTIDDISVEFWEDELLFTSFTADLAIDGRTKKIAINRPLILSPFTHIRLTSFGYAPIYMVMTDSEQAPLEEGATMLNIFPPGTRDLLQLQNFPHRIYLRFYPDWQEIDTISSSRSMRLDNPRFDVEVYRGKISVARKTLFFGENLPIEAFNFSILGVVPTVELTVVRDLGLPLIVLAFVIVMIGMALRLPGRRSEILAVKDEDGRWQLWGKNIEAPQ